MRRWLVTVILAGLAGSAVAGPMPVPAATDEPEEWDRELAELDRHIDPRGLPSGGRWQRRARLRRGGHVLVQLLTDRDTVTLNLIDTDSAAYRSFVVGRHASDVPPGDPRSWDPDRRSPILFSIRLPAPDRTTPRQLVVYTRRTAVLVASRDVGARRWRRVLRLDFPARTRFEAHPWSDPH